MIRQHQATCRSERQSPNSRNFGLRSKDINSAAKNALYEKLHAAQNGFGTVDKQHESFRKFSQYLKEDHNIRDMRNIQKVHVQMFAEKLNERIEKGEIGASRAQNVLSAVNSVLSQAIGDNSLRVTPKEAGLPSRTGIATTDKSISEQRHQQVQSQLPERLASLSELQRELAMRFQESCKCNPQQLLKEALTNKVITIKDGTKGGQARQLTITSQNQIEALKTASVIQGNHYSMIPKSLSYAQFHSAAYREYTKIGYQPHGERHSYAQKTYSNNLEKITGTSNLKCPVVAGVKHGAEHYKYLSEKIGCSVEQAKNFDYQARMQVAEDLGHHRVSITNAYLG
ncbi:integrase domain-containing protein [Vibrio amylolyticus]|uniref:integrase domain-containing protein n=1 Tax=Vibrio amylolyticus TaxID=2847292 RepID=UPI00354F62D6